MATSMLPKDFQKYLENHSYRTKVINWSSNANGSNSPMLDIGLGGRTLKARVIGTLRPGKVDLIETSDGRAFVYQRAGNEYGNNLMMAQNRERVSLQRSYRRRGGLIILLSRPIVLNHWKRRDYSSFGSFAGLSFPDLISETKKRPYLQIVEDIYIPSPQREITKDKIVTTSNPDDVTGLFSTFYDFLQNTQYKSFYNFLKKEKIRNKEIKEEDLELDTEHNVARKIKVLDYVFPNQNLGEYLDKIKMGYLKTPDPLKSQFYPFKPPEVLNYESEDYIGNNNPWVLEDDVLKFKSSYNNKEVYLQVLSNLKVPTVTFPVNSNQNSAQ